VVVGHAQGSVAPAPGPGGPAAPRPRSSPTRAAVAVDVANPRWVMKSLVRALATGRL